MTERGGRSLGLRSFRLLSRRSGCVPAVTYSPLRSFQSGLLQPRRAMIYQPTAITPLTLCLTPGVQFKPGNTIEDPDASEEAVPKSEGRAELPFLPALRQDVPGRSSGPCVRTGKVQSGRAGRGWTELSGYRIARVGGMAERSQGRTSRQDVSTTSRAAGNGH